MNLLAYLHQGLYFGPGLLLNLLITLCIMALIYYLITLLPLPALMLRIVQVIFAVVVILWLAGMLTGCAGLGVNATVHTPYGNINYDSKDALFGYRK